ncbi:hypothetical protein BZA77DRAFT_345021 [Pyronema omphalodes]|nr:hypothetical protein BZA77DRAFT_345021 [Pyronema omphalodes]
MTSDPPPQSPNDGDPNPSEPLPISPATGSSKLLIFHPETHPLPSAHIAQFRACINPAYTLSEKGLFNHLRLPDEDAAEFLSSGRWIFAYYLPHNLSNHIATPIPPPSLPPITDHLGTPHNLTNFSLAGTVSVSIPPYPRYPSTPGFPIFPDSPEIEEFHLHLLATSVGCKQLGVGSKLLDRVREFAEGRMESGKKGKIVAEVLEEVGNTGYYMKRGFVQEGERWGCEPGTWGAVQRFHLRRMVRWVEGAGGK